MYYDAILILFLLFHCARSLIYEQVDSHSFAKEDIIYVEDGIPSKIACVHKCMYLQGDALYTASSKCQCVKKGSGGNGNGNEVPGTHLKSAGKKDLIKVKNEVIQAPKSCKNETTKPRNYEDGSTRLLHFQELSCISQHCTKIISKMAYIYDTETKRFHYAYTCCETAKQMISEDKETSSKKYIDNFLEDLRTHQVDCGNGFLKHVKYDAVESKYRYGCCKSIRQLECITNKSPEKDVVNLSNSKLLRNYPMECPSGYAMSSFRMVTDYVMHVTTRAKVHYEFKCCSY